MTRCAACKYLRRRCASDCIFSPYFPPNNPQRFACVHRIYGASNIGKMLQWNVEAWRAGVGFESVIELYGVVLQTSHVLLYGITEISHIRFSVTIGLIRMVHHMVYQQLPVHRRAEAADCLYYEAQCRMKDPVYGCVGLITLLHQEIHDAQSQLAKAQAEIFLNASSAQEEPPQQQQHPAIEPAKQGGDPQYYVQQIEATQENGDGPSSLYGPSTATWFC
ncbi:hypothetical protein RJ640_021072 [Escallonia rubra]|uniref:LOB domain-containing protein n=1 Tax=Escallonia rubra TaxID=112253 RepID=A0AA88QVE5_9ASTE|nr:hypothetical protein RJ640_021072 [Escallonia rubra]